MPQKINANARPAVEANEVVIVAAESRLQHALGARERRKSKWADFEMACAMFSAVALGAGAIISLVVAAIVFATRDPAREAVFERREAVNREVERLDAEDRERKEKLMLRLEAEVERAKRRGGR